MNGWLELAMRVTAFRQSDLHCSLHPTHSLMLQEALIWRWLIIHYQGNTFPRSTSFEIRYSMTLNPAGQHVTSDIPLHSSVVLWPFFYIVLKSNARTPKTSHCLAYLTPLNPRPFWVSRRLKFGVLWNSALIWKFSWWRLGPLGWIKLFLKAMMMEEEECNAVEIFKFMPRHYDVKCG